MASEYVSRKSDSTSKVKTQTVPGKTWTLLEVEGLKAITPKGNSTAGANWAIYLNIDSIDASELIFRWVRDPHQLNKNGIHDFTGQRSIPLKKKGKTIHSAVWVFQAKKGQAVGVEMFHDGSKPITINTRETKMMYEVGK